jgi:hypothetical protein
VEELIALQNINSAATADECCGLAALDSSDDMSDISIDLLTSAPETNPIHGNDCSTEKALISLASIKFGSRFGIKVFNISDETRLVGKVCVLEYILVFVIFDFVSGSKLILFECFRWI